MSSEDKLAVAIVFIIIAFGTFLATRFFEIALGS
jgi:hypothetical protein